MAHPLRSHLRSLEFGFLTSHVLLDEFNCLAELLHGTCFHTHTSHRVSTRADSKKNATPGKLADARRSICNDRRMVGEWLSYGLSNVNAMGIQSGKCHHDVDITVQVLLINETHVRESALL